MLVEEHTRTLTVPVASGVDALKAALAALDRAWVGVLDVGLRRSTLDDVFLTLTGHVADRGTAGGGREPAAAGQEDRGKDAR